MHFPLACASGYERCENQYSSPPLLLVFFRGVSQNSVNLFRISTFHPGLALSTESSRMRDFDYEAPATLNDAVQLLGQHKERARILAGGTDLIDHVRLGRLEPDLLIDVKKIAELNALEITGDGLRLGASVPAYKVYQHPEIASQYAALADSCHILGGIQIQSRASVGGNVCNSGPAADTIPSVIALEGTCVIAGPKGERKVPAEDFCTGPGKNVLQPDEMLVAIEFPARPANSGSHYRRFIPRNEMDIAVVGVGVSVVLDDSKAKFVSARVALGAVGPTPILSQAAGDALSGHPVDDVTISKAAAAARESAKPITDMRGTVEHRLHLAGVITERVIRAAVARARGEQIDYQPGH